MKKVSAKAEVKTNIEVRPSGSQTVLVTAILAFTVFAGFGTFLISAGSPSGWFLILCGMIGICVCLLFWKRSQSDLDLSGAHPTQLTLADGTNVATDSRILRSPQGLEAWIQIVQQVLNRKALPQAEGVVDENFQVVPGSKKKAIAAVAKINKKTQELTNQLVDVLNEAPTGALTTQRASDSNDLGPENKTAR